VATSDRVQFRIILCRARLQGSVFRRARVSKSGRPPAPVASGVSVGTSQTDESVGFRPVEHVKLTSVLVIGNAERNLSDWLFSESVHEKRGKIGQSRQSSHSQTDKLSRYCCASVLDSQT